MTTQIAKYTPEVLEVFKPEVLQVIRTSLCPTATDAEFTLFAHKAASYRLDPFKNEIFFIKYGQQARIQFAAEAYLAKAREKDGFQPPDTQMVCEKDEFKVQKNVETKELEVVEHEIGFPRGKIIGAYSIAYRDGYRPVTVIMDRTEIDHMFTGQNKDNWIKWTSDMFSKHVEQRALKKQYGLDFGDDEIPQQAHSNENPTERRDITSEASHVDTTPKQPEQPAVDPVKAAMETVGAKFVELGITDKKDKNKFFADNQVKMKDWQNPTLAELQGVIMLIEQKIAEKQAENETPLTMED